MIRLQEVVGAGPTGIAIGAALAVAVLLLLCGGIFVALIYIVSFIDEAVENRAMKAGFPHGYAKAERERRKAPQREAEPPASDRVRD